MRAHGRWLWRCLSSHWCAVSGCCWPSRLLLRFPALGGCMRCGFGPPCRGCCRGCVAGGPVVKDAALAVAGIVVAAVAAVVGVVVAGLVLCVAAVVRCPSWLTSLWCGSTLMLGPVGVLVLLLAWLQGMVGVGLGAEPCCAGMVAEGLVVGAGMVAGVVTGAGYCWCWPGRCQVPVLSGTCHHGCWHPCWSWSWSLSVLASLLGIAGAGSLLAWLLWSPFVHNCCHRRVAAHPVHHGRPSCQLIIMVAVVGPPCRCESSSVALVHAAAACCCVLLAIVLHVLVKGVIVSLGPRRRCLCPPAVWPPRPSSHHPPHLGDWSRPSRVSAVASIHGVGCQCSG